MQLSSFVDQTFQDLQFALRVLRKSWRFTLAAVSTLALGIGANTTMFSVVNAVLLRPLPGYETNRLVRITNIDPHYAPGFVPPHLYLELVKRTKSFEVISALQFCPFNLTGVGDPQQVWGPCTSANWFAMQHARPFLGRAFAPDEDQRGRSRVVVLSFAFWKNKFNASPQAIGRVIALNAQPWTIIGVMPRDFKPLGVSDASIFTPNVIADNPAGLIITARLKPGAKISSARAELQTLSATLANSDSATWKGTHLTLTPELEQVTGAQRPLLLLLMGAVSFVLLIACVNIANLLLARSKARQHEMAVRIALGASRSRIVRFVLTEVLLICCATSVVAVAVAYFGISALRPLLDQLPRTDEISVDTRVFVWVLVMGCSAALLAGIVPALRSAEPRPAAGMAGRTTLRWQTGLLAAEVALTLVLFIGAGLLIRTLANLRSASLGYDPSNTLTSFLAMPAGSDAQRTELVYARIRERLSALRGVKSVATASSTPAGGVDMAIEVEPEGRPVEKRAATATVDIISPQYFRTLGIKLRVGRFFTEIDRHGGTPVVIVSESIARRYFANQAVGRRLHVPAVNFGLTHAKPVWADVVGVVDNVTVSFASATTAEHIYLPEAQTPVRFTYILLRTDRNPRLFTAALRHAVTAESPSTPLDDSETMVDRTSYLTATPRRALWLLEVFAALAGILSGVGIYAVSAYLATQRTREIAIRLAVGASNFLLIRAICRKPFESVATGLLLGIVSAIGLTRFLKSVLFGVGNVDLATYACAAGLLLAVALLAAVKPASRVIAMDVAAILKQD